MNNLIVTIITPSFNQGEYIEKTILSVLNQSYPHIEYIIIDALSTDTTSLVLDKYENNPRVSRIIREKDDGQADAIEKGFRMAKGEIVGWINSDDILAEDVVEKSVVHFRENSHVGLTYGDIVFIDGQGKKIMTKKPHPALNSEYLLNTDYDVFQPGSFYRKSAVEGAGYLNRDLNFCMDLDLWLGILGTHEARYINGTASFFRWYETTKTANGGLQFLQEIFKTLNCHQARFLPKTKRRILWYSLKTIVKKAIARPGR